MTKRCKKEIQLIEGINKSIITKKIKKKEEREGNKCKTEVKNKERRDKKQNETRDRRIDKRCKKEIQLIGGITKSITTKKVKKEEEREGNKCKKEVKNKEGRDKKHNHGIKRG